MDSKGINGSGLAHLWGTARSEFAQKKFVTETVYPLSSKENYTGVEVPFADDYYVFRKVSDNVYRTSEFIGKKQVFYENGVVTGESFIKESEMFPFSDNGSWSVGEGNIIVIQTADVGKPIRVPDVSEPLVFPEAGTYFWTSKNGYSDYSKEVYIAGTYKRELEPQDIDFWIHGYVNTQTMQLEWLDQQHSAILKALDLNKDVRLRLSFDYDGDSFFAYGRVESWDTITDIIEFGATVDIDLGDGNGKQLYHVKVTLLEDNTLATEYEIISVGLIESDSTFRMFMRLKWNTLTASFPSEEAPSFASLSFEDIQQALTSSQSKNIVTRIAWYDDEDDSLSRNVYTSDISILYGFWGYPQKKQIVISAILNIDVQNGLGKQDYYFKFILNEDKTVTTEYTLVSGGNSSEAVSPTVEVTSIEGGHRVTITDVKGNHPFDVLDGKKYVLTDADKAEMVTAVINALPTWQGGSY